MESWELVAREQVRDTVAAYSHSGDGFRLEDLAACFTVDGVLETKGGWTARGREEIIARLSGVRAMSAATVRPSTAPSTASARSGANGSAGSDRVAGTVGTPGTVGTGVVAGSAASGSEGDAGSAPGRVFIRHFVTNLRFESVTPERIATSAYFAVLTAAGLDHWGRYRDVLVPAEGRWLFAHRLVRIDAYTPTSPFRAG